MPKFSFKSGLDLTNNLAALGMQNAFDWQKADFSGMTTQDPPLYLSKSFQKAYIVVNERGTEAGAANFMTFENVVANLETRLDRPFLFMIIDQSTGAILFMGRMEDPR